jgi:hypothetical protein
MIYAPSGLFSGGGGGGRCAESRPAESDSAFASAALLAAHLAFISAESCARRSGERLSFFFGFLRLLGFFAAVEDLAAVARAADFLAAFIVFAASAACSFCFSLASFFGASCRRFSSRRIFFFKFFSFMIVLLARKAN